MEFITQYTFPGIDSEKLDKENLFEYGTYRDTKTQVEEFILAGKRLESSRLSQFDNISDDDDFIIDPTRQKNFDLADASDIINKTNEAINLAVQSQKESSSASETKQSETKTETEKLAEEAIEN